jgi:hypothetical protein
VAGCVITDGDVVAVTLTLSGGVGSPQIAGTVGILHSNASSVEELRRYSECYGGSTNYKGLTGGGELCFSLDDDMDRTDVWTVVVGIGPGAQVMGAEIHGMASFTRMHVLCDPKMEESGWSKGWRQLTHFNPLHPNG